MKPLLFPSRSYHRERKLHSPQTSGNKTDDRDYLKILIYEVLFRNQLLPVQEINLVYQILNFSTNPTSANNFKSKFTIVASPGCP
jgi:hypothetical protein